MKPRILLVDDQSDFVGLAYLLEQEKYPYTFCNLNTSDKNQDIGKGLISSYATDFWPLIYKNKPEDIIIVLPDQYKGYQWDVLRKQGYIIIGGGHEPEEMEYNRSKGLSLLQDAGLSIPEEEDFTSLSDALSYMETQPETARKYFKGEGEDFAGNSYTYGSKNKQDMISYLTWIKEDSKKKNIILKSFILQDKIDGYAVDFSFYFDSKNILPGSIAIDLEEKKGGDQAYGGSALGCSTNYIYFLKETKYKKYFDKLVPYLRSINYRGQWSINNVFRKEDAIPFALENTSRFGHDSFETECLMNKANGKNVSDFLLALAGRGTFQFPTQVGYGVRLHCDYPTTEKKRIEGRYFTIEKNIESNVYFYNVSKVDDCYLVVDNPVGVAVTVGNTLKDTVRKMNDVVLPGIYLSDLFARTTPPDKAEETIRFLHKNGWIE